MGRNCIRRHVEMTPAVKGFRPFGRISGRRSTINLSLDEYEAIRLLDHQHLTQEESAVRMGISRPTLTRIYERARTKFATALVEGCILLIGGGDIKLNSHVYLCQDCGTQTDAQNAPQLCEQCGSPRIIVLKECYQSQCGRCGKCHHGGRNAL